MHLRRNVFALLIFAVFAAACSGGTDLSVESLSTTTDAASETAPATTPAETTVAPTTAAPTTTAAPSTTAAPATTAATGDFTAEEQEFLNLLQAALLVSGGGEDIDDYDQAELVADANGACAALDGGATFIEASSDFALKYPSILVGGIGVTAIETLCPQHDGLISALGDIDPNDPDSAFTATIESVIDPTFLEANGIEALKGIALDACAGLEDGDTVQTVLLGILGEFSIADAESVGVAIGAGIAIYCPEYVDELESAFG